MTAMSHYIYLSLLSISFVAIIRTFDLIECVRSIIEISIKIPKVMLNKKIGDSRKQVILPAYAIKIIQHSSKVLGLSLFVCALIFGIDTVSQGFLAFLLSPTAGIVSFVICGVCFCIWNLIEN